MRWWKKTSLMICLCTALSFTTPNSSICAEAALNIEDIRQASAYKYDLVSNMRKTPNKTGTWVKSSKGYRFKLKTNQYLKNGWARIDGRIYCFDANGYRRVGFYTYRNRKYYFKSNGQLAINYWLRNGDRTCYLKPDGKLVYSTCTISDIENRGVVERFLYKNKNFFAVEEKQTIPYIDSSDGFYFCTLQRSR